MGMDGLPQILLQMSQAMTTSWTVLAVATSSILLIFSGWTTRQAKAIYRIVGSFFIRNFISVMEDQAGLKLFSLDAPQRYSGAASCTELFPAQRLGEEDVPTNTKVPARLSLSSDDASSICMDKDEILEEETFDVDECSRRALWRRWSTMARLEVSQVEEESLHNSCLYTNLFACMDEEQSKELYELGMVISMSPGNVLVSQGDSVAPGIFLVI